MNSTGPTATDIQFHLYNSFIQGNTYDVAIRVLGTWRAVYKLHRVVLIQSGFFRALFTAGFLESKSHRLRNAPDEITVVFDDFNITRPAFEICLSRLYGGGPPLHISPSILPTTDYPLTPPFAGIVETEEIPTGHHLTNHRLLLSLLATSIYLSIPSVASHTLSLILKTVGPTTVIDYLKFACGKCLVYSDPLPADSQPAVGLENIADLLEGPDNDLYIQSTKSVEGLKSLPQSSDRRASESPEPQDSELNGFTHKEASYHYGTVSNKIGEACACWIARWAVDILQLENEDSHAYDSQAHLFTPSSRDKGTPTNQSLVPWKKFFKAPVIWGREGLNARWVAAFVSADTLFVKNERDRYDFARTIVELRRKDGLVDEEEDIWSQMFEYGIYYTNMTFEDLHFISHDISPITKKPYVSLHVLQMAHWQQSTLRHQISCRPLGTVGPSSPLLKDKELGITIGTAEILTKLTDSNGSQMKERYYPVFVDQSLRIGDGGSDTSTTSMEDLFRSVHNLPLKHCRANTVQNEYPKGNIVTSEEKFFGISTPCLMGQDCVDADSSGKLRWSPYPPYRFSVEFWDVDILKEKNRLHSQTVWYAGSLFNIYVQVVRKKGQPQLGIYLHRQSHVDSIPASSIPALTQDNSLNLHHHLQSLPNSVSFSQTSLLSNHSPAIRSGTSANQSSESSPSPPSPSTSATATSNTANFIHHQPYRDPRTTISAYFSINCASATGSSQTRFSSSPDTFSVSQSWGWKSSSLRTEEFLEIKSFPVTGDVVRGREVSLRATVVLGLV